MSRDVAFTLFTRLLQVAGGFGSSIVTARFLGPSGRGDYFYVVTLTLLVVQVANLGLPSSNTFFAARDRTLLAPLLANSLVVSLVGGSVAATIAVAILRVGGTAGTTSPSLLWFAVALAPPTLFFLLAANLLVGIGAIRTFNVIEAGANLLVVGALLAVGALGAHAGGFLAAGITAWTFSALAVFAVLATRSAVPRRFHAAVFRAGLAYSLKAWAITLAGFLVLRLNVFFLEHFKGAHEVGYYSIAAQLGDVLGLLPASIALLLFPELVRAQTGTWERALRASVAATGMLLVASGLVFVLARPFVDAFFGHAFEPAVPVIRWMLPGAVALGATTVLSQHLAAIGMPKILLVVWGAAVVLVFVVGIPLTRYYGASGAAVTLSGTYVVLLGMMIASGWRFRHPGAAA